MATQLSDQMTKVRATPPQFLKANEHQGVVYAMHWSFTTPVGGVAINDIVLLGKLPKGARILDGREFHGAMSSGAGAATVEIGTYTDDGADTLIDVDAFLAATSVDAAGQTDLANTLLLGATSELAQNVIVGAKATVEAWAAAQTFKGYVLFSL